MCYLILFSLGKPAAPMNIKFPPENTTNVSLVVQWDAVIDQFVDGYVVVWNHKSDSGGDVHVNNTLYTITGLDPNTTYFVSVFARNKCGKGRGSIPEIVTTNLSRIIDGSLTTKVSVVTINPTSASTTTALSKPPFISASTTVPSGLPTSSIEAKSDSKFSTLL